MLKLENHKLFKEIFRRIKWHLFLQITIATS